MAASRHILREHIFKILFDLDFHTLQEADEQIAFYFDQVTDKEDVKHPPAELTEEERTYVAEKARRVLEHFDEIDEAVAAVSVGWKTSSMPRADLTILRLAVYEIRYDDQIPAGVAINEAVELSKRYGTDATPGFVNGVLAKFA